MAEESVQPVPWVFGLSMRLPLNHLEVPSRQSRSFASLSWWPPLQSTAQRYCSLMAFAAATMSSGVRTVMPESTSVSGMFGVSTVASGSRCALSAAMASSLMSLAPLVATMTGSTTMFSARYSRSFRAMTSIRPVDETMPILTASGRMSVKMLSSCWARKSGDTSKIPWTPVVFWAVKAVMALMA